MIKETSRVHKQRLWARGKQDRTKAAICNLKYDTQARQFIRSRRTRRDQRETASTLRWIDNLMASLK